MCRLILVVVFAGLEVPIHGYLILLQQLVIDADIVIAGRVLRSDLGAFNIPGDCLSVHFLRPTVAYTDFIGHPHIFWEFLSRYLELGDFVINFILVSCKDEVGIHVLRVYL